MRIDLPKSDNFIPGFTTTSISSVTLTAASTYNQVFTGPSFKIVTLPVATTLSTGHSFFIRNDGSAMVQVQTSTSVVVGAILPGDSLKVVCVLNTGTLNNFDVFPDKQETKLFLSGLTDASYYSLALTDDYGGGIASVSATTTPQVVKGFISPVGFPNLGTIPTGEFVLNYELEKTSGANSYTTYFEVYTRETSGTETLQVTSGVSPAISANTPQKIRLTCPITSALYTIGNSDRIVVKIYVTMVSGTATVNLNIDGVSQLFTMPFVQASSLNFVPYVGAQTEVNVGSQGFRGAYLELGNTLDTTLTRNSAGVIAVEGVVIPSVSSTNTLTNKRITKRVVSTTQSATPSINTDNGDIFEIVGLAQAITSMTTNLTGTPVEGQMMQIIIKDNGTARAITWGSSFVSSTSTLPTTTVISTPIAILLQYRTSAVWTASSAWYCIAVA